MKGFALIVVTYVGTTNQNSFFFLQNEEPSEVADYSITEEQIEQGRPSLYQAAEIEQRKRNEALGESRGLQLSILDNINTLRKGKQNYSYFLKIRKKYL